MVVTACGALRALAETPTSPRYKLLPPPGLPQPAEVTDALTARVETLNGKLRKRFAATRGPKIRSRLIDLGVRVRAVEMALQTDGFYRKDDAEFASRLLGEVNEAVDSFDEVLAESTSPFVDLRPDTARGSNDEPLRLVAGYRSRIDGSLQPYGVVIWPQDLAGESPLRLDVWLHGRGDTKAELAFLRERLSKDGTYRPEPGTVMVHPFGRHCNAFKFAGEEDVFEVIADVRSRLAIDERRVHLRGFSMGGAGVWHLGVHHPRRFVSINPGAGFVDTIVYQRWTDSLPYDLGGVRESLLNWYDVLPWTQNLAQTHVVAYSGEVDKQRQAAERVIDRAKTLGVPIDHVIGVGMGHKIDEASKEAIQSRLEELSTRDRSSVDFTTYTLRYTKCDWVEVMGLSEHWKAGGVRAKRIEDRVRIETEGITAVGLDFSRTPWRDVSGPIEVTIGSESYEMDDMDPAVPGFQAVIESLTTTPKVSASGEPWAGELRKRPGLQGPIDDAFCDSFIWVLPSRPAAHGAVQRWIERESKYAVARWRSLMRGDTRTVLDIEVTPEMAANNHLICFGDFESNRFLRQVANRLPLRWDKEKIQVGDRQIDAEEAAIAMIYPNPIAPNRYLVINSGMTFREFSNVSNSRQIAMLGDYAVFDVTDLDDSIFAGKILDEGFFDELWRLKPSKP